MTDNWFQYCLGLFYFHWFSCCEGGKDRKKSNKVYELKTAGVQWWQSVQLITGAVSRPLRDDWNTIHVTRCGSGGSGRTSHLQIWTQSIKIIDDIFHKIDKVLWLSTDQRVLIRTSATADMWKNTLWTISTALSRLTTLSNRSHNVRE